MAEENSIVDDIGMDAGQIYRFLKEKRGKNPPTKATEVKNELDFSTSDVYLALGWLAREDQVEVLKKGNSVRAKLKD